MKQARFLPPAEIEMFEAATYYETRVAALGEEFLRTVETAVQRIVESPEVWSEVDYGLRKQNLRRFPFSILYRIDPGEIVIVAIMHQRQRPRYWIGRL